MSMLWELVACGYCHTVRVSVCASYPRLHPERRDSTVIGAGQVIYFETCKGCREGLEAAEAESYKQIPPA